MKEGCNCRICLIKKKVSDCLGSVERGDLEVGSKIISEIAKNPLDIDLLGFELLSQVIGCRGEKQEFVLESLGKIEGQIKSPSLIRKKEEVERFLRSY